MTKDVPEKRLTHWRARLDRTIGVESGDAIEFVDADRTTRTSISNVGASMMWTD
jgi:hypothetical protein